LTTRSNVFFKRPFVKSFFLVTLLALSGCHDSYLAGVDLASLLIQVDPPQGLNAGIVEVLDPQILPDLRAIQSIAQTMENSLGHSVGKAGIYLFRSHSQRDEAFQLFGLMETPEGLVPFEASTVGEDRMAAETEYSTFVTFVRCYAVASVWVDKEEGYDINGLIEYAERLDEQRSSLVCP
jgi:hypothetical protein